MKSLEKILRKLSFEELKNTLGQEIISTVEFITDDLQASSLIKVALKVYGITLLEKYELRAVLIANKIKESKDNFDHLAVALRIKESSDITKQVIEISRLPFKNDTNTKQILEYLGLPETYLPIKHTEGKSNVIEIESKEIFFELLDYQQDIRVQVIKYYNEIKNGRLLVHMPTGSGKTKTAMHILQDYWQNTHKNSGNILWLAHTEELLMQALETFQKTWSILGRKKVRAVKLWGSYSLPKFGHDTNNSIIFAGTQKLISILKKDEKVIEALSNFRLIVIDEAHKAPAKETFQILVKLLANQKSSSALLGLTATPGRNHGHDIENVKLKNLFDGVKIGVNLELMRKYTPNNQVFDSVIKFLQFRKILSVFKREEIHFDPRELNISISENSKMKAAIANDQELSVEILRDLARSKVRNRVILDRLRKLYHENANIILFACNIEHAKIITAALSLENIECGLILGDTSTIDRVSIINNFKNPGSSLRILINVNVLTTGFDAPNIDCVFIARPVSSIVLYSQIIGRGIRGPMMGGTETCKLIEVIDDFQLGDESWAFKYFDDYWN